MELSSSLEPSLNGRPHALRATSVSKRFGPTRALDEVSFELERGTIHALLGGNGSGKSTLIKILAGVENADDGQLELGAGNAYDLRSMVPAEARAAGLRFVHQQSSTFPEMSIAENLALGARFETGRARQIRWREVKRRAARVMDRFQINGRPDDLLSDLSPAMQTMVAIARALQDQADLNHGVLLLDEPTAALPEVEVRLLLEALRRYADAGQSIVFVTHRLEEVFAVADRATLLRDGRMVDTITPEQVTRDRLVELIMGTAVAQVTRTSSEVRGPVRLDVRGLTAGAVQALDLTTRSGEIVGIAGLIGSGRSSLLRALAGALPALSGEIWLDGASLSLSSPRDAIGAGLAYLPEWRGAFAFPELTVQENLSISHLSAYWRRAYLDLRAERRAAEALLDSFLVKAASADAPLQSLSGGNQQKVLLARCLAREPRVLLLDEPTQGVDVGARAEIHGLIQRAARRGATVLVASSDFEELAAVCDRAIVLRRGSRLAELAGVQLTADRLHDLAHSEVEVGS